MVRLYGSEPYKLVLVHSGPGAIGSLKGFAQELSEISKTGVVEAIQSKYSITELIEELYCQTKDNCNGKVTLIGYSWGAWLVAFFAEKHPELVENIILVGCGPLKDKYVSEIGTRRSQNLSSEDRLIFQRLISNKATDDIPLEYLNKAFEELNTSFECSCADFMLLTALMKLGFSRHETIHNIIAKLSDYSLPDGGYFCWRMMNKLDYTPKSYYKANLHALMFIAECHKQGMQISTLQPLIDYFLNRNIFYKSTDKTSLVLDNREGWRNIDTFYPFEVMRVGLQNILEAFCALGYGNDERLQEAWTMIDGFKDDSGKIILKGTLTKSYLPKEKVGKASKWATFYTLLAEKERIQ